MEDFLVVVTFHFTAPKNDVLQGSVPAPLLFNTYNSDLSTTVSKKEEYSEDLAIIQADGNWHSVQGRRGSCPKTWKFWQYAFRPQYLKIGEIISPVIHHHKATRRELRYTTMASPCRFAPSTPWDKIWSERSRTTDISSHFAKIKSHIALLTWLTGTGRGAAATPRKSTALSLGIFVIITRLA